MITSGSKSSHVSCLNHLFEGENENENDSSLRCSLEQKLPPLAGYSLHGLNVGSLISPFQRQNDQHPQGRPASALGNSDSCSLKARQKAFNNFELFMWFLPSTQLLLEFKKRNSPLQEHQAAQWFIFSQTLIFNPGVGISATALGFHPWGLERLQWNSIAKGPGACPDFLFVLLAFYLWKAKGFPLGIKQRKQPTVVIVFRWN